MRLAASLALLLVLSLPASSQAASYVQIDFTIVDPILDIIGDPHVYSGPNLKPGADLGNAILTGANLSNADLYYANLSSANLSDAFLVAADLTGATYNEVTTFPSGGDIYSRDWGLPGAATPWGLLMVPAPEPASGAMLCVGCLALAVLGRQ